jgi:hypothetical protein
VCESACEVSDKAFTPADRLCVLLLCAMTRISQRLCRRASKFKLLNPY